MHVFLHQLRNNKAFAVGLALLITLATIWFAVDRPLKEEKRLQERINAGKDVTYQLCVPVYLWRGLSVNVALAAVLAAGCLIAGRKLSSSATPKTSTFGVGEKVLIGFAVVIAALQGASRLGHSTWGDEDYTVKTYISDQLIEDPKGVYTSTPTPWTYALWHYKRPNNHTGYSVMANLVHSAFFERGNGPRDPIFSEVLVRTPAFLFGLLSLATLAWMGRVHGVSHGVAMVLVYYAIHPWLTRFGTDARA